MEDDGSGTIHLLPHNLAWLQRQRLAAAEWRLAVLEGGIAVGTAAPGRRARVEEARVELEAARKALRCGAAARA